MEIGMAEINEPTPVKPIWPTRRDQQPAKRSVPESNDDEDRKRNKQRREQDDKKSGIDEYV